MKQFLALEERDKLKKQYRKERDKRICDRIKAVLLFDDDWNCQEIPHVLLLSDEAVKQHIQEYCNSQKLRPENGGSFIPKQAEGAGEYSGEEKSRFYHIAKRSATECAGICAFDS